MKKRPDGRYVKLMKYGRGGEVYKKWFYGYTEAEVIQQIADFELELKSGRFFRDVAEEWAEEHFPTLAYNTLKGYKPALRRAIDQFGDRRISDINAGMINIYLQKFSGLGYSQKVVSHLNLVISLIMQKAVLDGDIHYNPASVVKLPKNLPKSRREAPSEEDMELVRKSVHKTFGLFPYFILYTGCRKGEALALRYGDIDFENKLITIAKSLYHENNRPKIKTPKTEAGARTIILLDGLADHFGKDQSPDALIFPNDQGQLMTETQYLRKWELYCAETGISCTAHQLRHAYTTILYEAGIPDKDAQELLGHSDISTTRNIYTHISRQRKSKLADLLNSLE